MSVSHFFKHLVYLQSQLPSHSRHFFRKPPPLLLLPSLSSLSFLSKPNDNSLTRTFSSSSASSSTPSHTTPYADTTTTSSATNSTEPFTSKYLSVRIRSPKHASDVLSEALLCFGASSTCIEEQEDHEDSDQVSIDSTFALDEDVHTCISSAASSIGLKSIPNYEVEISVQEDWIKKTQESFHPIEVIEGLWIVPEWNTPPNLQAKNVILNPGLAFGTGEHPTTKLCLLLLHGLIKGGERFLDYGTGSGILAIAALKLGAASAVGVDIDPQAISSAQQNAALNSIEAKKLQLHLVSSEISSQVLKGANIDTEIDMEKYDLVVANILLNPLLDLAEHIVSHAKPGAIVGLSGILSDQVSWIMDCYSRFLEDISVSEMDGWACVRGRRKGREG